MFPTSVWKIALALFLVANPIGNTPAFVTLVKDFDFNRQKKILFREALFSFILALLFLFIGEPFLQTLSIESYSVSICGGTLLFLVALQMIFPHPIDESKPHQLREPFIVPIATPLISGGGVLTMILVHAKNEQNMPKMVLACTIAWIGVISIVVSAAYVNRILGKRGLLALEQLMGMILAMLSMDLIVKGALEFAKKLS